MQPRKLDFSIPPTIPRLNLSIRVTTLEMIQQNLYVLLLLRTVFHSTQFATVTLPFCSNSR